MKRLLTVVVVLLIVGAAGYVLLNRSDSADGKAPVLAGVAASADILARGEYLTKAADCVACHTVPGSDKPYAGGLAFKLPFGTIYSTNITADPEHGIGTWTDDQFVRAVREGIRNDGQRIYPAFPYTSYTLLSRDDVLAIKAYLFSLAPIAQADKPNELGFPFNQRWAMGFWNAVFFKSQRFVADDKQSPEWNSGAYLATALGHCGECHTPRNLGFGLKQGQALAGESLQGWRAYNITSDKEHGIGAWSDSELASYLASGHAEGHASAAGPMGEVVEYSLQHLAKPDVAALVTYLRSVPAQKGKDPITVDPQPARALASSALLPGRRDGDVASSGEKLFAGACASCHQWNGNGQQAEHAGLLGNRGVNDAEAHNVTQIILKGIDMHVGDNHIYMPGFAATYSDTEIAELANYVVTQFGNKQGKVSPAEVAERRDQ